MAHGSRREASNEEIRQLTRALAEQAGAGFESVSCAFLELVEPSIPDAIEQAVRGGAQQVLVLPYFLSAGRHVAEDIPELVEAMQRQHPQVDIRITPYLGAAAGVPQLLLDLVGSE